MTPHLARRRATALVAVLFLLVSRGVAVAQAAPDWRRARELGDVGHALAYDVARGRLVAFGGAAHYEWSNTRAPIAMSGTWEWDGGHWTERAPGSRPTARTDHAMAYDAARGVVVLFGGTDSRSDVGDTWAWDGIAWTRLAPATSPPAMHGHALAYDAARGRVVLFGGRSANGPYLAGTWEWDGSTWTQRTPVASPPGRAHFGMAYDSARQRVVLFGGWGGFPAGVHADTWEWDGNTWSQRAPAAGLAARGNVAMAYDVARRRVVLFGGRTVGGDLLSDTWEWDGSTWLQRLPAAQPDGRQHHAMAYDLVRRRVVLLGSSFRSERADETWEWDGTTWTLRASRRPCGRTGAVAYDATRGRAVLFGGYNGLTVLGDTWEWDGAAWNQRGPANSPGARMLHAMAYDLARQRVVLFGGLGAARLGDTWEWDGRTWVQRTTVGGPPPRMGHAMAYDGARQRVVLFGGVDANGGSFSDTWEWDGTTWGPVWTAGPAPRSRHAMAYDVARQRVVLFGGSYGATRLADTWEWDGVRWLQRAPATAPPARDLHAMAYDSARQRVVLFGGAGGAGALWLSDTWEWDGTNWTRPATTDQPAPRWQPAMVYDVARQHVVLFGGFTPQPAYASDTWHYGSFTAAAAGPFGLGCRVGGAPPALTSNAPYLGSAAFRLDLVGGAASSPCVFAVSTNRQAATVSPCTLYVGAPVLPLFAATNGSGFAASPAFALPSDLALRGLRVYAQGFVADPRGPVLGTALSAGLELVLGD